MKQLVHKIKEVKESQGYLSMSILQSLQMLDDPHVVDVMSFFSDFVASMELLVCYSDSCFEGCGYSIFVATRS